MRVLEPLKVYIASQICHDLMFEIVVMFILFRCIINQELTARMYIYWFVYYNINRFAINIRN